METINLEAFIMNYALISFDIFDTLLLRTTASPDGVFSLLWNKIVEENLLLCDLSSNEFRKLRIEAERRARSRYSHREVSLEEIYHEMPDYVIQNKAQAEKLEIETEKECCYRNEFLYSLIQKAFHAEKTIVLLSDMYIPNKQLKDILVYNGIAAEFFKSIFVSCEEKCSKQDGGLYYKLLKGFPQIPHSQILHIGDNRFSDFEQALQVGISAYHYDVIPEKLGSIYDYEKIRHNSPQESLLSLRKLAVSSCPFTNGKEKSAYEIGASIVGPFLSLFISHVYNRLISLDIHRIYPFMREGWLLGKMLAVEAVDKDYELMIKPIYISRHTSYFPSIETINREEIENMMGTRNLTIKELIVFMGLNINDFHELQSYFFLPLKESHKVTIKDLTVKEYLIHRILEPKNIQITQEKIKNERELFIHYLQQEIGSFDTIATIDIGFFGRIPLWLEKCLELEKLPYKMKHFLAIGITGDKLYNGMNVEGYYSTFAENQDLISMIHRSTDILEKLISVSVGSTIGYSYENNYIKPITDSVPPNNEFTNAVFEGILEFQRQWHWFRKQKPILAEKCLSDRRATLSILHRLIDMPRLSEVQLLKDVTADTNFGTTYQNIIITSDNLQLLKEKGIEFIDKCNVSYTYQDNKIVWPKGLITLKDEFFYVRRFLKEHAKNEILSSMQKLVEQIHLDGIQNIALYGAGENGRQFLFFCSLYHISVDCFIDRKQSLWGKKKEGIAIRSLQEAIHLGIRHFLITSLFSINEIETYITKEFKKIGEIPTIYSI